MQLSWLFNLGRIFTILESLEISVNLNIVAFKGVVKLKKMTEILSWLRRHWNINIEFYNTKFLGVHIIEDLTWSTNTMSISKKAQQCLHFLHRLKRASLPPPILTTFYRGTIESVLTSCITVWYGNCSAADRKTLQRTVNTAAKIIGAPLHPGYFPLHDAPVKPIVSWRTPIHLTVSSSSYHQEDGTRQSAPPDCSTDFSPRLWEPWTQLTLPPLSETPYKPHTPETWTISTPPPPHLTSTFLCNSKCATHRRVVLYKPPVVTHSPLFALDTFTHYCVYITLQKTQYYMYVYMFMHFKSPYTVP